MFQTVKKASLMRLSPVLMNAALVVFLCVAGRASGDELPPQNSDELETLPQNVASESEIDPYESFNRSMFNFNEKADQYVLKPIAKGYQFVTPKFIDEGITNIFDNIDDVETFFNSLLQGKFHNATVTLNRIIYNTTFGLGGFFDVATFFGLINDEEDFGQTLAVWGYEQSDYIVLPLLGPSTIRDTGGFLVDGYAFNVLNEIDEIDSNEETALTALKIVDKRADLLAAENLLIGGDRYVTLRNVYMQNREFMINDGEVADAFSDDDLEDLDGF